MDFPAIAAPAEGGDSGRFHGRAIAFAIGQPADVDINEIVLRPTAQEF